jgi:TetR/AcrR family transcriptional repressor of nem operon
MARHRKFISEEVIDKSIDVFLSRGYEATAVKDIVEATDVHPGSLYNAFGNKKDIFMLALERFVEVSQFNINLADAETAPPRAAIEKLFHDLVECTDQRGSVGRCLISKAAMELGGVDEDITAWLKTVFEKSEDLLCQMVERGQAEGEFLSPRPARELAQFLATTVQGMQLMSRFDGDKEKFQAIAKMALTILDQTD